MSGLLSALLSEATTPILLNYWFISKETASV